MRDIPLTDGVVSVAIRTATHPYKLLGLGCNLCVTTGCTTSLSFVFTIDTHEVVWAARYFCSCVCASEYTAISTVFYIEKGIEVEQKTSGDK